MTNAEPRSETVEMQTIVLHGEEAFVGVRKIVTARVRVETVTNPVERQVREPLATETVEITHVPRGHFVAHAPETVCDGDTIIVPVLEERVVVERRLFLKEELHIRRVRNVSDHSEVVVLRQQDVVVHRTQIDANASTNTSEESFP